MSEGLLERWRRRLFGRDLVQEVDEELSFHIEMRTRELVERGVDEKEARERALARFGDVEGTRAECETIAERREKRMARAEWWEELGQDVRFALRSLLRRPLFALVAVATLVLGIGANSAIFSVVNGVVLQPLPFPEADRFVHLGWSWDGGGPTGFLSAYKVEYFGENAESFTGVATYRGLSAGLGRGAEEEPVTGLQASSEFLDVVGYPMALGRWFTEAEDRPGGGHVVVLGHGLWQNRFAGDPDVLGRTVELGGVTRTVLGVLPRDFRFPQLQGYDDVVVPFQLEVDPRDQGHNYPAIARLRDGVDRERAAAELATLSARFAEDHPELTGDGMQGELGLSSYQEIYVGSLSGVLWIMLGAVGLVLLIACANVANLLLARTTERSQELAVRSAMGASRGRIVRLLLTESVVLSLAAGVISLGLAAWATKVLLAMVPYQLPRSGEVGLDLGVILFTFGAALATAVLFGLAAALPTVRRDATAGLREGTRGTDTGRGLRNVLVVAEAAVSIVLLVGAGLLIGTLVELRSVDPGFEAEGLITATMPRWPDRYTPEVLAGLEAQLMERLAPEDGIEGPIEAVGLGSSPPLRRGWNLPMQVEGRPDLAQGDTEWRSVSPGYFEAVGLPIVRGREFNAFDNASAPRVVIVNETFAEEFFPDSDPVGQRIEIGKFRGEWVAPQFEGEAAEIVGVVSDMREISLRRDAKRTMLVPRAQARMPTRPVILVRSDRPGAAADRLRQTLQSLDASLPPPTIATMESILGESLARERFNAVLMTLFAGLAVALTAVGIFGVVSYGVRRRTREIGVRIALGAEAAQVTRMVTRQGMVPVVVGILIGGAGAALLTRFIQSMIWGVSPTDPLTFVAVAGLLTLVAFIASWVPARRAARADPVDALAEQ